MPNSLGNCLMTMVSATPKTNPFKTGLEMKSPTKPSFNAPATRNSRASTRVTAHARTKNLEGFVAASGATVAARITADDEVGETANCRLDPINAYASRPNAVAYNPACGGRPAIPAYPIDSGMSSPASATPAITSPRRLTRWYRGSHSVMGSSFISPFGSPRIHGCSIGEAGMALHLRRPAANSSTAFVRDFAGGLRGCAATRQLLCDAQREERICHQERDAADGLTWAHRARQRVREGWQDRCLWCHRSGPGDNGGD